MKKKDFEKECDRLDDAISNLRNTKAKLVYTFRDTCPHREKDITMKRNDYQDEYGRWMDHEDYDYTCTRCGITVHSVLKQKSLIELQKILRAKNNENKV